MSIQKNVGHTPRKLRLVVDIIRKLNPDQAIETLQFVQKAPAIDLIKAIKTALANAGNKQGLRFKKLEINEGLKMKRYRIGTAGRGRGRPYKKRLSHIKIVLTDEITQIQKGNKKIKKLKQNNEKELESYK